MAERKPLFMDETEGFSVEMAVTDSITLGGLTMSGIIDMGTHKIVNLADGIDPGDAINKEQLDSAIISASEYAERIENLMTTSEAIAQADPVYLSGDDVVGKGRADADSKSKVIGIAKEAILSAEEGIVVSHGLCEGILSGATANTPYYLQATGGIGTNLPPGSNKRIVQVGIAANTTDLWVRIIDYGKK